MQPGMGYICNILHAAISCQIPAPKLQCLRC
jgi:hypothetical protein